MESGLFCAWKMQGELTMWKPPTTPFLLAAAVVLAGSPSRPAAQDQGQFGRVIRVERNAFTPRAGLITFAEVARGTRNPVYPPARYGADAGGVTVTFGGFYEGQRLASSAQCPRGASKTGCVEGTPVGPLRIAQHAPRTLTLKDVANPRSPSLSGSPRFNGPVSMVFDRDVAGVGLFGGFFDRVRTTAIHAYSRDGRLIGGVKNIGKGMEYMALVTEDGSDSIAGLQFSLVGPEPAGFGIDDLSFAFASQLDHRQIPGLEGLMGEERGEEVTGERDTGGGSLSDLISGGATPSDGGKAPPAPAGDGGSITDLFKE